MTTFTGTCSPTHHFEPWISPLQMPNSSNDIRDEAIAEQKLTQCEGRRAARARLSRRCLSSVAGLDRLHHPTASSCFLTALVQG